MATRPITYLCVLLAWSALACPRAHAQETEPAPAATREERPREDVARAVGNALGLADEMRANAAHPRLRWHPTWPRYRFDELVLTLGMGLIIGLAEFLPTRSEANWAGVTRFDTTVQDALGLDDPEERELAERFSDVFVSALIIWPTLIDSILYAGAGENAWDVAWQLSLISLEAFAINHALNITIKLLSRRSRPINVYCSERPEYAAADPACADPPPAESFWSGHVSNAFTGAALVCLHHDMLDLYGHDAADGTACGGALALAVTTALLRVMSDRHWLTDVLVGSALGSLVGALVPWLLHYRGGARPFLRGMEVPPIVFMPMFDENTVGMSTAGLF